MSIQAHIEPLEGRLPSLVWRWDAETDILSGAFKASRKISGLTGTMELTDDAGSVVVLEVSDGVICGLDVVVWPEVSTKPGLAVPAHLTDGRVIVAQRPSRPGIAAVEVDTTLRLSTDRSESIFHLQVGEPRPLELVRIADHLQVGVDGDGYVASFWLTGVPPFPESDNR